MKKLVWKRNKVKGQWELKVNDVITINLDNVYLNSWTVYININDETIVQIGGFYDYIADAKAKGLKVAQAILEED